MLDFSEIRVRCILYEAIVYWQGWQATVLDIAAIKNSRFGSAPRVDQAGQLAGKCS